MNLTIEHAEDLPKTPGEPTSFTGIAYFQTVAAAGDGSVSINRVTFEKGARTFWHKHSGEQVLYFLEGRGRVQVRGERAVDATVGDVVHTPPNTEHWHGSHPDEPHRMRHIAIYSGTPTWLDPVSEDEYRGS